MLNVIIRFLFTVVSVQSTPANNTRKRVWQYIEKESELAPGTVNLTRGRAQGDDSKHDSHYSYTVYAH